MTIDTTRFGTIDVSDEAMLTFPEGILGFESVHTYCLLEHAPKSPFLWLQAITDPSLAFVVIDPFDFVLEYDIAICDADADFLQLSSPEDVRVMTIVTFNGQDVTTNLVGPLVVNARRRVARQVVLADSRYTTRHLLRPEKPLARMPLVAAAVA